MNEGNNFEIINTENPIENNVIEQENSFDLSNLDKELKNIDLSYVNNNIDIVEPSYENTQKLFENIDKYTFDENGVVTSIAGEESVKEKEDKYTFDENGVVVSVTGEKQVAEETPAIATIEETTSDDSYNFDTDDAIKDVDYNEGVKPIVEDNVRFTFDENGVVTSITSVEEPVATEVLYDDEKEEIETPTVDNEKEKSINNINNNREKINEEFARLNKIIDIAKESGVADSEYLVNTFEKMEVFDSVNKRFNKDLDDYIVSLNNDDLNNDSELSNMQF